MTERDLFDSLGKILKFCLKMVKYWKAFVRDSIMKMTMLLERKTVHTVL